MPCARPPCPSAACLLAGTMVNAVAFQLMKNGLQGWPFGAARWPRLHIRARPGVPRSLNAHCDEGPWAVRPSASFSSVAIAERFPPRYPMLKYLEDGYFAGLSLLILRVVTASLMVHHGLDKLQHVEGFSNNVIAVYFSFLPGPPEFWTYLSASFELGGSSSCRWRHFCSTGCTPADGHDGERGGVSVDGKRTARIPIRRTKWRRLYFRAISSVLWGHSLHCPRGSRGVQLPFCPVETDDILHDVIRLSK